MKIIAIVSAKGGVGKTTVAANLSTAFNHSGQTVLAVDIDPQNALRFHLGIDPNTINGISRATLSNQNWREACFKNPAGIYTLPYGSVNEQDRHAFERHLEAHPDWLLTQLQALKLGDDDLVVLDTPPGPSIYMRQVLSVAHMVIIVTLADAASYATLPMMEGLMQTYCTGRPGFVDYAVVINQLDLSRQLSQDVSQVMRANFGERVVGLIRHDQAVCEALAFDQSVLDYDTRCQATRDFLACAQQVMARLRLFEPQQ